MDKLLEHLYEYVQDESGRLCQSSRDYRENHLRSEDCLDRLRAGLAPEALRRLEEGLDRRDMAQSEELRAVFRAALSAGLALGSLGRLAE